jgi:hypothetical protein
MLSVGSRYLMKMMTCVGEPDWEYTSHHGSDAMAYEWAKRVVETSRVVRQAASAVVLFNLDSDDVLAHFVLDNPKVRDLTKYE